MICRNRTFSENMSCHCLCEIDSSFFIVDRIEAPKLNESPKNRRLVSGRAEAPNKSYDFQSCSQWIILWPKGRVEKKIKQNKVERKQQKSLSCHSNDSTNSNRKLYSSSSLAKLLIKDVCS